MAEDPAALRSAVLTALHAPAEALTSDDTFDQLARRVFAYQYERNTAYGAYCRRRGRSPTEVAHWSEIPPVPTPAFREMPLFAHEPARAHLVFRTSGTTSSSERRGEHYMLDGTLYEASLMPTFAAHVLPDGQRPRMLAFMPPRSQRPDSSLAYMVDVVMRELGASDSTHLMDAHKGLDVDATDAQLARAVAADEPVCLLGTSFSFVHLLDHLAAAGRSYALPPGSRLMDTGGYKGRSRDVPAGELRALYERYFGLEPAYCVNEYGMTELSSQYYDACLLDAVRGESNRPRRKLGPPWLRPRVVHPETLEPVPAGTTGVLAHFDLANLDSVAAVLTEDLGQQVEDGFNVLGRAQGASARGCSIALDDLLRASRESA